MFGISDVDQDIYLVSNHILLSFKHFIYISRDANIRLFSRYFRNLQKVHNIEQKISQGSERKKTLFHKKWQKTLLHKSGLRAGWNLCEITVVFILFSWNYVHIASCFLPNPTRQFHVRVGVGVAGARCGVISGLIAKTSKSRQLNSFWCLYCWLCVYFVPCSGVYVVWFCAGKCLLG